MGSNGLGTEDLSKKRRVCIYVYLDHPHRALAPSPRSNGVSAENVLAEHLQSLLKHHLLHQVFYHALVKLFLPSILCENKTKQTKNTKHVLGSHIRGKVEGKGEGVWELFYVRNRAPNRYEAEGASA